MTTEKSPETGPLLPTAMPYEWKLVNTEKEENGRSNDNFVENWSQPEDSFLLKLFSRPIYLFPLIGLIGFTAFAVDWFTTPICQLPGRPSGYLLHDNIDYASQWTVEQRVERILNVSPLIDTHIDLPILLRFGFQNKIYGSDFTKNFTEGDLLGHVDIPRLKESGLGGVFWSVYTACPKDEVDPDEKFKDEVYWESIHDTIQQVDVTRRLIDAYPDDFVLVKSAKDVINTFRDVGSSQSKKNAGRKVASVMGIEGLHQIGNSPAAIRLFYEMGVRYITLNHNCNNQYSDGALVKAPHWGGLNPKLGPAMIHEFNRLGMLVDLSHVSADTMRDVLKITRAPVIFSHSSAFALTDHPRNVPDDVLELVKKNGGVVQVNFYPAFIYQYGKDPKEVTIDDVADHVMYIGEKIGYDHVGFGSDFDGIDIAPKGLEDISKYPDLIALLLKRGVKDADVVKLAGQNVLRVWEEADKVSAKMKKQGAPILEDEVKKMKFEL